MHKEPASPPAIAIYLRARERCSVGPARASRLGGKVKILQGQPPAAATADAHARERLVVVGNGMAGMRTVEELLACAPDRYDITVIGTEPQPNYNRILLSSVLAGEKTLGEIIINARDWYEECGIRLLTGDPVTRIDRTSKRVEVAGCDIAYD